MVFTMVIMIYQYTPGTSVISSSVASFLQVSWLLVELGSAAAAVCAVGLAAVAASNSISAALFGIFSSRQPAAIRMSTISSLPRLSAR